MLPKTSSNAHCLAGILRLDGPIVGHNCVGALVACPRVAALAWPPCLGAGTVAGGGNRAEAAEVLPGLGCLLSFVVPAPLGGCTRHVQGAAHTKHSLCKKGVFLAAASGVHGRARGTRWQRQPLIINYFRWMLWWTIQSNVGIGTSYKVRHVQTQKNDDGDVEIKTLMKR